MTLKTPLNNSKFILIFVIFKLGYVRLGVFEYNYLHILRDIGIRKWRHGFSVLRFSCNLVLGSSPHWKTEEPENHDAFLDVYFLLKYVNNCIQIHPNISLQTLYTMELYLGPFPTDKAHHLPNDQ